MGDIVNIKDTTDKQLLERFKRLEDIIPECMNGVSVNPLIQYIKDNGEVSVSLIEFFNHSEFLELLTPDLLLIGQELFDKKADTEWYKLMLYVIEEKEDIEAFCKNIPLCVEKNIDCETVREMIEKSNSSTDMTNALTMYMREQSKENQNSHIETCNENDLSQDHYIRLCKQQEDFISQLLMQIEELKQKLSLNQKYEEENKALSAQIEQLESNIESLQMYIDSIERQLQNALKNRQTTHNHFIEQKRSALKYQLQAEKLQKQITDTSDMKVKCEELENTVVNLEEEKVQLESRVAEGLADVEQLHIMCEEQKETIQDLNHLLSQKDNEITQLAIQMEIYEEQLKNQEMTQNTPIIAETTEIQGEFSGNEMFMQERIIEEEEEEMKEFPDSQMISFESGLESVKKKSKWFTNLIAQYSKKSFLKNSRQDQESMIFIKMMEMHYPMDKMQKVKKSLTEIVPCFDLYKLICKEPSIEELDAFFAEYEQTDVTFA